MRCGKMELNIEKCHFGRVTCVKQSWNRFHCVSGSADGSINVYDIRGGRNEKNLNRSLKERYVIQTIGTPHNKSTLTVEDIDMSRDASLIVGCLQETLVSSWKVM